MDNKRNTELKLVKNEDGLIQIIGALDYTSVCTENIKQFYSNYII